MAPGPTVRLPPSLGPTARPNLRLDVTRPGHSLRAPHSDGGGGGHACIRDSVLVTIDFLQLVEDQTLRKAL